MYYFIRYDPVFHVSTYVAQYTKKMIPTSADDLETKVLWPPPVTARPGRTRRRRLQKKQQVDAFEVDPVLPSFVQVELFLCFGPGY